MRTFTSNDSFCFSSSTLTFVKSLVCLSQSRGCWTAPPVILLTHAHTQSLSVCLYSALRRLPVWNKALSRPYLPSTQLLSSLHFLRPLYFILLLFHAQSPYAKIYIHISQKAAKLLVPFYQVAHDADLQRHYENTKNLIANVWMNVSIL